ncbi:MAG TPA: 3-isopropylmalate dehydratase small subunit [Elusimicrobiota bacterium]|nr:3-isopropylmalate dehydratase small subunit [Elusimicrobiota bacterium]
MINGTGYKFGDNVDTDQIIPAKYLVTTDAQELAKHCMEIADADFPTKAKPGDILVAGRNFGCGSSREHAPLAIKGMGLGLVIAESFARIFFRNCINIGMPILECPEAARDAKSGDQFEVDLDQGAIKNLTQKKSYQAQPFPDFMQQIISAGGLMPYVKKRQAAKA